MPTALTFLWPRTSRPGLCLSALFDAPKGWSARAIPPARPLQPHTCAPRTIPSTPCVPRGDGLFLPGTGAERMNALIVSEPRDLNMLWFLAHARHWCPYNHTECALFEDPVVQTVRDRPGMGTVLNIDAVKGLWATQLQRHAHAGSSWRDDGRVWRHLPSDERETLARVDRLFHPLWDSHIGVRAALGFWHREWNDLFASTTSWQEWCGSTVIRSVDIVGAEDDVVQIGSWTIAGAWAIRSPSHFLDLVGR